MLSGIVASLAVAAAAYGLYAFLLHPALLSPLARIPSAHWSCAVSGLWILAARRRGRENRSLGDAHRRLGRVVRVAPNALSVDGVDAVRAVYQAGFDKWPWYSVFDNYGLPCLFSTLGAGPHARRKRALSHVYSKSYVQASAAAAAQARAVLLGRLLPLLRREAAAADPGGTEVQAVLMATTMDLVSAYVFGLAGGTAFLLDEPYRRRWLRLYLCRHRNHFWSQELPGLAALCARLGLRLEPPAVDAANEELRAWNKRLCDRAAAAPPPAAPEDEPVVFKALHAGIDREERRDGAGSPLHATAIRHRHLSVASEILDQVLAGHETAGIALTYLAWHLSLRPALQARLRRELRTLAGPGPGPGLPDARALDRLPLLHAVVVETLRLHAPIPGPQPRVTPQPGCSIGGFAVPGGVRVAALAHTLHLDEAVYPGARRWDPARWLPGAADSSPDRLRDMGRHFWAFGSGGRMCVGSNFAMNGIKNVVAAVYANFATAVVDDAGMEQTDGYSSRPAGEALHLSFTAL